MSERSKKSVALAKIDDLVSDLLYYSRKDDEDLPVDDLSGLITSGAPTVDEIVDRFRAELVRRR